MPSRIAMAPGWLRPLCIAAAALALASCSFVQAGPFEPPARTLEKPHRNAAPEADPGRDRPDPTPDNTENPWKVVPFDPQYFWDWLSRNAS